MISRRGLLMAFLAAAPGRARASQGFSVSGPLTATGTEEAEHIVNYGKDLALFINDDALWAQTRPLIGTSVRFTLEPDA